MTCCDSVVTNYSVVTVMDGLLKNGAVTLLAQQVLDSIASDGDPNIKVCISAKK